MSNLFIPPTWLRSAHGQTLYPTLMQKSKLLCAKEERLELPDGDFIDLVWSTDLPKTTPLILLLHGLGGGVDSAYVAYLMNAFNRAGFRSLLMYFRGASPHPNRLIRAYHSGDTADFDYLLQVLHAREPLTRKAAVGISLGGNVLLKWLGEQGGQSRLNAAVVVSVPFQLGSVAQRINRGFSRIYQSHLLNRLKMMFDRKMRGCEQAYPFSLAELKQIKTLGHFDEVVTAPLHGFKNAKNYYDIASAARYVSSIQTPTLILHAEDDPFMDPSVIPAPHALSSYVQLEVSPYGGHVGFVMAKAVEESGRFWLAQRIPAFLKDVLVTSV